MLPLISHQQLLIKVISQPEIELLITAGTLVNQRFKGAHRLDAAWLLTGQEMMGGGGGFNKGMTGRRGDLCFLLRVICLASAADMQLAACYRRYT